MKPPPLAYSALSPREFPPEDRPEVAVMGRSNAGKSTLLNALVGSRVAHVSQDPGRTRRIHFYDLGTLLSWLSTFLLFFFVNLA